MAFQCCGVRLLIFAASLGYSRVSFVRFVSDETWPTVKACLEAAFGYSYGVPREVLFVNIKTVVLECNTYGAQPRALRELTSATSWARSCFIIDEIGYLPFGREQH